MNFKLSSNEVVTVVMSNPEEPESPSSRSKDAEEQSLNDKEDESYTFNCSGCADDFEAHPNYFSKGSEIVCGDCLKAEKKKISTSVQIKVEDGAGAEMDIGNTPKALVDDTCHDVAKKYCPVRTTGGFEELGTLKTFDGNGLFSHNFEAAIKFRNTKDHDKVIFGVKGVGDTSGSKKGSNKGSKLSNTDDQGTVKNRDWFCPVKIYHENNSMPTLLVGFYHSVSDNRVLPIEMTAVTNVEASACEQYTWTIQKRSKLSLITVLNSKNRMVEINHDFSENEARNQKFQIPTIHEIENRLCAYLSIKTDSGKEDLVCINKKYIIIILLLTYERR